MLRQRLEIEGEIAGGLKALFGILLEAMTSDALECRRDVAIQLGQLGRVLFQNGRHGFGGGIAAEGALAAQHFEEDGSEGEDVRSMIDAHAAYLFGRHVARGAQDLSGLGECDVDRGEGLGSVLF